MAQSGKAWLGWTLGMVLVPPILAGLIVMAGKGADVALQLGGIVYLLAMVGVGIGAVFHLGSTTGGRVALFFALLVGMLFAQCAIFFVGCTVAMSLS